ncbi:hypothetical protein [Allonocardiopsis opalescens]|uniref:Uncharacterized protein n=1 Tax=Allonocardiopsis opalescens TaxID=1144618 RepID=A0A2T0Q6Y4_9ACTN|nr:hypothetical protein [Allonocardiopsis opalescens]PRX99590.1 hypothetical protein CLV72_103192 [Allonocardiopsis opalescens]
MPTRYTLTIVSGRQDDPPRAEGSALGSGPVAMDDLDLETQQWLQAHLSENPDVWVLVTEGGGAAQGDLRVVDAREVAV